MSPVNTVAGSRTYVHDSTDSSASQRLALVFHWNVLEDIVLFSAPNEPSNDLPRDLTNTSTIFLYNFLSFEKDFKCSSSEVANFFSTKCLEGLKKANYNVQLRQDGASKRWRDYDAQMSDIVDQDSEHKEPPSFHRNTNDKTNLKRLSIDTGRNYEDLSPFFNYCGDLFISVKTDEAAYDVLNTHLILRPVLQQFQVQEAHNNNFN